MTNNLEKRVAKLENSHLDSSLDEFLVALHASLYPDAPPLMINTPSNMTIGEFWKTCRVLRPAIASQ
jgi:hypothetical protein